ncbi:BREX system ATP-binding domain-containing protein [Marmoricola sp. URHB0036]|uniref:BREX system ATP-binding domain-containing protein n=1 Tax=Marmoricola sp. URHB0036 TaxID=1298863 RepID=UPI00040C4BD5|nr:BREX system ATP-binding domain-containing protein [Marmoricola sp. URHB0036]
MWVRVLGPSQVALGDDPASVTGLGARKPRSVVAALALRLGSDVSPDLLVDLVWGAEPPRGAHGTLHSYLSGVRRVLEPGLGPRQKPTVLLTSDHGYRLDLPRHQIDAHRFADEVRASRRVLAPLATQFSTGPATDWPDRAAVSDHVDRLEGLLGLWSGEAYADLPDHPDVVLERSSLDQLRRGAEEDRVLGLLALGDHAVVVAATEQATARYPLQERVWALHALALARSGRQADALAALRRIRRTLADELGLDPGQELRDLEQAVLAQDPVLQQWLRPEAVPAAASASAPAVGVAVRTGWDTVGRDRELAELGTVLDRAAAGEPAFSLLVGEPGIGKSRLAEATQETAAARGFVVATGRCAQDDGAPPLWPWSQALDDLGRHDGRVLDVELERLLSAEAADPGGDERQGFRAWESIAREVLTRSEGQPLLLVLEDLHWADTGSLRVLRRLIASSASGQRLAVLLTRRPFPEPTGSLADVGEELARHHVTRVDLTGLDEEATQALVSELAGDTDEDVVTHWHARSEGNPFFVIELARLGGGTDAVPATVRDVVTRRLEGLPEETRAALLLAAVLGRVCSLDVLAAIAGQEPDQVDEALAPAREAGLVREPGAGVLAFAHALTRDAVAATATATGLARQHARVAHALSDGAELAALVPPEERVAELARHWLAAGPSYAGRAWRAAVDAAAQARRSFSWVEAANLMSAAIEAHRRDPSGTPEERIDLLLTLARDFRPNAEWNQVLPAAAEAVSLARRSGDLERLTAAASAASDNLVWLSQQWNEVLEDLVDDLRWGLAQVPPGDSPQRCRLMLALAMQLYYDPSARAETIALADEGHAMARRIDDAELRWWACHTAWKALWSPTHLERRVELGREGLAAARASGDEDSLAIAHLLVAATALESGDRATFLDQLDQGERAARRRRNSYALMAVAWVHMSLAAMAADDAAAARYVADVVEYRPRLNPVMETVQVAAAQLIANLWNGQISAMVEPLVVGGFLGGDDMSRGIATLGLARGDRRDLLRGLLDDPPRYAVETWASTDTWCGQAEAAAVAGDIALAEEVAGHLRPLSGRLSMSGISVVMGPVDGYLSLALVGCGQVAEASAAADRALAQAAEWQLPAYAAWLEARRQQLGF